MVYKQYPKVTATGINNVEKMDLIYNTLMQKAYGEWSKFVCQAIFEKWERDINITRMKEHQTYTPIFELIEKLRDYGITRRYGMTIQNAYKANVISPQEIDIMYNILETLKRDCIDSGAARALSKTRGQTNLSAMGV